MKGAGINAPAGQIFLDHQRHLEGDGIVKLPEIQTGELLDLLETVDERISVDEQLSRRFGEDEVVLEELVDRKERLLVERVDGVLLEDLLQEHFAQCRRQLINEAADAETAYFANYDKDWAKKHKTVVTPVNLEDFEKWIGSSHRKTKAFAEYKSVKTEDVPQKVESSVSGNGYTIEPAQYTTKRGKVLDMHLVKFQSELRKEVQKHTAMFAKEMKGWWDREKRGFMMRSEEDARRLVDNVLEEDQSIVMYDNVRFGGFSFNNVQAIDKFNTIKNALTLKYDMYVLKEDTDIIIFEDDRTGIILDWEYGESRGGKMLYYVTLSYYDKNLSDKQFQKEQDEL